MSVYQTARRGVAIRHTAGLRVGDGDLNQLSDALLAAKRVYGGILGGEGIYAGGAAALGDIADGTDYPAVTIVVADDSGELWPFKTTSATAITFNETSTAAGDARLYAVPVLLSGVSPAAADGRYNQVRFVADDVANAAPAHSLLLGTGTVTASALTAFTAGSTAPATSVVAPKAHAASHQNGGADEVATATPAANAIPKADGSGKLDGWLTDASTSAKGKVQLASDGGTTAATAVQATDSRLSNARTPTAHAASHAAAGSDPLSGYALLAADNTFAAAMVLTNGRLRNVRDAKFGSPASGTYVAGDVWMDRAGAIWYCVTGGTPGTWEQVGTGRAGTWSGGTAADITAAANWNGGALLANYVVYDTTKRETFDYNGTSWLGPEISIDMGPGSGWVAAGYSASTNIVLRFAIPSVHDIIATAALWQVTAATADASNKWTLDLRYSGATSILTLTKDSNGNSYVSGTPTATVLNTATHRWLYCELTKTGSPAAITTCGVTLTYRKVRK